MMNNKILRAAIFLFLLFWGVELTVFPDNVFFLYKRVYQRTMRSIEGKEVQSLFLGDSHAAVLNQNMLNPLTYNLASSADTTREMYLKILYVFDKE